jgi:O-acetylhomoserine (thiol)-lyase
MDDSTKAVHAGYEKSGYPSMAVPIYQTTAYEFRDASHAAALFELEESGDIYTRLSNPTTDVFEKRFAALEGGSSASATASGMSAIFYAIANCAGAGDNIAVARQVYGGTTTLTTHTLARFGIEARFFDIHDMESLREILDERSRLILFETISNPSIDVADIADIVSIADEYGIVSCADNTVATPILCKPLREGVDVVVHSTSKYTTGQGLALGGIVVERENIVEKLSGNGRYDHFNKPDPSYHGLVYTDIEESPFTTRVRLSLLRDFGASPSPFNSWLYIQGLETLPLRMVRHSESALKIARFLENHPAVSKVNYPGLESDPNHERVKRYMKDAMSSGLLSFEVEGRERAQKIADSMELFSLVVNIGDSKSIVTHPASTTHQQLSAEELEASGVPAGLIRLSVGLEDPDDLISDLDRALSVG